MSDDYFTNHAEPAGEIKGNKETSLIVKSGRLYHVRCLSDVFWVVAQNKDQVRKLLFKRGGEQNLKDYTITRHYISHCESIISEVEDYNTILEHSAFIEKHDKTDYSLDCDE